MGAIGSAASRSPFSMMYGKLTRPLVWSSTVILTTWASKMSRSRSPTRSYIACISRFSARPRCTSLMSASSALRWRVSSNSRAFSSATLRLPASVVRSRTSASLNACSRSMFWSEISPVARSPTRSGTKTEDLGASPAITRGWPTSADSSLDVVVDDDRLSRLERDLAEAEDLDRARVEADPSFDLVGEVDAFGGCVEDLDIDDLRVEDLLDPVADQVVHRLHLEVLGEAALDVVDERELGVALPGLLEQPSVLERDAQAPGERRQEPQVGVVERVLAVDVLERDHPGRPAPDDQRHEHAGPRRLALDDLRLVVLARAARASRCRTGEARAFRGRASGSR